MHIIATCYLQCYETCVADLSSSERGVVGSKESLYRTPGLSKMHIMATGYLQCCETCVADLSSERSLSYWLLIKKFIEHSM